MERFQDDLKILGVNKEKREEQRMFPTVFSHIAGVLRSVHAIGILHADVLPASIVYVEALDAVSGVLIDWRVSFALAEVHGDIARVTYSRYSRLEQNR